MSHRSDCPTQWEAERQGERAFERGSSRYNNPYERQPFSDNHCREAERSWEDGHRQAERRAEEEAINRRQEQRREQERQWAREEEERSYWRQQEEEQNRQMEEEYNAAMEAEYAVEIFWQEQEHLMDVVCAP